MTQYYTEEERLEALERASATITQRGEKETLYKRGYNDCMAFLMIYDTYLRGTPSEAYKYINFEWCNPKQFLIKLYRNNMTLPLLAKKCGYKIITGSRPTLGDIAFEQGSAMIAGRTNWYSPAEDNSGVKNKRKLKAKETADLLARPLRS